MNSLIFIVARHRIVPFRQCEHLQTPRLLISSILLYHLGLSVDVLEGEFGDVHLFLLLLLLLLRRMLFVEEDLVGALIAGLKEKVGPALVQLVYLFGGGRSLGGFILVLFDRYAFTDLSEGDLVLYFAHTDELVLHGLGGR